MVRGKRRNRRGAFSDSSRRVGALLRSRQTGGVPGSEGRPVCPKEKGSRGRFRGERLPPIGGAYGPSEPRRIGARTFQTDRPARGRTRHSARGEDPTASIGTGTGVEKPMLPLRSPSPAGKGTRRSIPRGPTRGSGGRRRRDSGRWPLPRRAHSNPRGTGMGGVRASRTPPAAPLTRSPIVSAAAQLRATHFLPLLVLLRPFEWRRRRGAAGPPLLSAPGMGSPPLLPPLTALLCFLAAAAGQPRGVRSCAETRQALAGRGFPLGLVPHSLISGEHLRVCPADYTCCASETEQRLLEQSAADLRSLTGEAAEFLLGTLGSRQRRFRDFFRELLSGAERSLQTMFTRSYGSLYTQNARLFQALFVELRHHLQGARPGLDEALTDFWARLLERMLPLLNPQYSFSEGYLECVGRQAESLQAFGDNPRQLRVQVTRAFIAARAFVQGLETGRDVVSQAVKLSPTGDCHRAYMRLSYCPLCRGTPALKPCNGFCLNVLKGCLASTMEMDSEWERFLDALTQLAERLGGPFHFELAADSISVKISEAIMYLQERGVQTSAKVFQNCGSPRPLPARSRRAPHEEAKRRFHIYAPEEKPTTAAGTNLDRLILDVKEKLRQMRRFWVMLPHTLCSDEKLAVDITNEDSCWNGQARGRDAVVQEDLKGVEREPTTPGVVHSLFGEAANLADNFFTYLPDVTGDGLVNQINNPEVEVDISKPDLPTRQQVLALRSATSRLVGACSGQDVDFQDADEDGSGGSGGGYNKVRPVPGPGGGVLVGSRHVPDVRGPRRDRPGKGSSSRQNQSGGRIKSGARPSSELPAVSLHPLLFILLSLLRGW